MATSAALVAFGQVAAALAQLPAESSEARSSTPPPAPSSSTIASLVSDESAHLIVSVDRLFGFAFFNEFIGNAQSGIGIDQSGQVVNVLFGGNSQYDALLIPRLSCDALVTSNATLGGSIGYLWGGGSNDAAPSGASIGRLPSQSTFVLAPRMGFMFGVGSFGAIWLRAGVTYHHSVVTLDTTEQKSDTFATLTRVTLTTSGAAFSFDPVLLISPIEHIGFVLGPSLDVGFAGKSKREESSSAKYEFDSRLSSYGVTAGMLVWF